MRAFMLLVLACAVTAVPPLDPARGGQNPAPVFRSGTDLVRFDVRVTDASGQPIRDLRPDEVEIVEDGASRPILLFQHVDEPAGTYAEAALRSVSAEVSTNRGAPRGHLYLLVFDQRHIAPGNEQIARRAAEAFIKARVRPSDRVAIVGIPGPGPQRGFTADRTRAVAELTKVHGELERVVSSPGGRFSIHEAYEAASGNDEVIAAIVARQAVDITADAGTTTSESASVERARGRAQEDPSVTRRVLQENARAIVAHADADARDSLERLADVIEQYRTVEGRKTVLFFSEGFHQANVSRELERVAAAAAQSYAVFYAFDLNRRQQGAADQAQVSPTTDASEILARTEPLGSLAAETDGQLIMDAASHLDAAIGRIAEQVQDYYLVGFTPAGAASRAGQYRRVSVRVSRPGAKVYARTGYTGPSGLAAPDKHRAIDAALAAPFAQQGLRIEYTTYALRSDNAGRARVILALDADLPLRGAGHEAADVVFVVRDMRDGRVVASGTDQIRLPTAAADGAATGIGSYRVHFDIPPGAYLMRTVVREPGGLVGSADRRLDVRGLTGPDVTTSDIVLGSVTGGLPVRARAYAQDGLNGMVEVYGRSPEQLQALSVTAVLVPAGSNTALASMRADLAETTSTGSGVMRRANFAVPLTAVTPGPYIARVKVMAGTETVADLTREVDVAAGAAPPPPPPPDPELHPRDVLDSDFVRSARASLKASSRPAAVRSTKGFDLFEGADYRGAAEALSEALELDPTSAPTAFVLGWSYEGTGDHREAIGAWRAAATIDPKMLPAHLALADVYLRMSERGLAEQAVRAGLAAIPDSPELQARLAHIQGKS
jgi:VWFA-related protein